MTKRIPVAPAAHYMCGGVKTNVDGATNITNLYVCGELASTGIMGANRLASNSLLECLVFGKRAVDHCHKNNAKISEDYKIEGYSCLNEKDDTFVKVKNRISDIMNQYAGIIKSEKSLKFALNELDNISKSSNIIENEIYSLRLENLICVCKLIINAALLRKESRGAQIREDYPDVSNDYLHHSIQEKGKETTFINIEK